MVSVSESLCIPDFGPPAAWGDWKLVDVCVAVGDRVEIGDLLARLENDSGAVEFLSPVKGRIAAAHLARHAFCKEGDLFLTVQVDSAEKAVEYDPRIIGLEERIAYQQRMIADLNDVLLEFTRRVQNVEQRLLHLEAIGDS